MNAPAITSSNFNSVMWSLYTTAPAKADWPAPGEPRTWMYFPSDDTGGYVPCDVPDDLTEAAMLSDAFQADD